MSLERLLEKIAGFQYKNAVMLSVIIIVFTLFVGFGITKLEFQSDMSAEML